LESAGRPEPFITGMLRSGTSLVQAIADNLPGALVAYQPFNRFMVETKGLFLSDHGLARALPLDDGDPALAPERSAFTGWLGTRRFTRAECAALFANAHLAKGAGVPGFVPPAPIAGDFFALRSALHAELARVLGRDAHAALGSKEILCEEFAPAMLAAGVPTLLVLRDPRAVLASAFNGRYRDDVGDRYPVMQMLGLWRKSAAAWLAHRGKPGALVLRYEDVVDAPSEARGRIAAWLGLDAGLSGWTPLRDHFGRPWEGNSSFGDVEGVVASGKSRWRTLLPEPLQRFIEACTWPEMMAVGYGSDRVPTIADIVGYEEPSAGVRSSYLAMYPLDDAARQREVRRLEQFLSGIRGPGLEDHFMGPDVEAPGTGRPGGLG
jgi:hypothetical protein